MKLIAFDGDHTLWTPLSGANLSDRTPTDDVGWPDFAYSALPHDPLIVQRDDGALFALRPEALEVLATLKKLGALTGVISYNHEGNVRRILGAFGALPLIDYIVAEWHTGKDQMLEKMWEQARLDSHNLDACDFLLVDDDPWQIYRGQCERGGYGFRRFGVDIADLAEVLPLLEHSRFPTIPLSSVPGR